MLFLGKLVQAEIFHKSFCGAFAGSVTENEQHLSLFGIRKSALWCIQVHSPVFSGTAGCIVFRLPVGLVHAGYLLENELSGHFGELSTGVHSVVHFLDLLF